MSQVATRRRLSIRNERVKVTARFVERGSILQGTKAGECENFEIVLSMESGEPDDAIQALMRLAHRMCFTESALSGRARVTHRHFHNGQLIELTPAGE